MIFFFILLVLVVTAQIAEFFIPPLEWMYNAHIYIVPVIVFYGAMALPFPFMLALAFFAGALLDALTVQVIGSKVEISVGWSILLYAVLAGIMHGLRPLFIRGRWEIHCVLTGICTSSIILAQYLMITFRRGSLLFSREVWWQIGGPGLMAMLMAPVVFWMLNWVARATRLSLSNGKERLRMNRRRLSPRLRIQFLGLLMLAGYGRAGAQALVDSGCARRGVDRANSWQLASDSANSIRARRDQRPQRSDSGAKSGELRSRFLSTGNGERISRALWPAAA